MGLTLSLDPTTEPIQCK